MLKTDYGNFDGDSWEAFCHKCLKIKYFDDGYQVLPAHFKGDFGIEGFTRTGIAFQCYCPDENYNPDKLYTHQRDKITTDLNKLDNNQEKLDSFLGNLKISKWIFLTPQYHNKDIVNHCIKKRNEFREKELSFLDDNFDVLIYDIEYFLPQIPAVLQGSYDKLHIEIDKVRESEVVDWSSVNIEEISNINNKIAATFPNPIDTNSRTNIRKIVDNKVKDYLVGQRKLSKLQQSFQEQYERFVKVIDLYETEVSEKCYYPVSDNKQLYEEICSDLARRLEKEFGDVFDSLFIEELTREVISDWLIRCPINFIERRGSYE